MGAAVGELFALDSNLYIGALRDPTARTWLDRFRVRAGPRLRLMAVVALELRAGARTDEQRGALQALIGAHDARGWLVAPGPNAYVEAGRVAADLAVRERFEASRAAASFTLDLLLAVSCRDAGITLVTNNAGDFARIARHVRGFRVTTP